MSILCPVFYALAFIRLGWFHCDLQLVYLDEQELLPGRPVVLSVILRRILQMPQH